MAPTGENTSFRKLPEAAVVVRDGACAMADMRAAADSPKGSLGKSSFSIDESSGRIRALTSLFSQWIETVIEIWTWAAIPP
jgi:hypothetical protein